LNRILSFYPVEVRPTLLGDLSTTLKAVISQRLVKTIKNERRPAVEIMLNTQYVSEMVAKGDFAGVKDAMEKSMAPGSQTFEDDLARMIRDDIITREEGLSYADSPTNLIWRLDNTARGQDVMTAKTADPTYEPAFFDEITFHSI
jgi:twitching motility protein PilU